MPIELAAMQNPLLAQNEVKNGENRDLNL